MAIAPLHAGHPPASRPSASLRSAMSCTTCLLTIMMNRSSGGLWWLVVAYGGDGDL